MAEIREVMDQRPPIESAQCQICEQRTFKDELVSDKLLVGGKNTWISSIGARKTVLPPTKPNPDTSPTHSDKDDANYVPGKKGGSSKRRRNSRLGYATLSVEMTYNASRTSSAATSSTSSTFPESDQTGEADEDELTPTSPTACFAPSTPCSPSIQPHGACGQPTQRSSPALTTPRQVLDYSLKTTNHNGIPLGARTMDNIVEEEVIATRTSFAISSPATASTENCTQKAVATRLPDGSASLAVFQRIPVKRESSLTPKQAPKIREVIDLTLSPDTGASSWSFAWEQALNPYSSGQDGAS